MISRVPQRPPADCRGYPWSTHDPPKCPMPPVVLMFRVGNQNPPSTPLGPNLENRHFPAAYHCLPPLKLFCLKPKPNTLKPPKPSIPTTTAKTWPLFSPGACGASWLQPTTVVVSMLQDVRFRERKRTYLQNRQISPMCPFDASVKSPSQQRVVCVYVDLYIAMRTWFTVCRVPI